MPLILGANTLSAGGYEVDNSLRFNSGSSDYLSRSLGASETSIQRGTFSFWVKRSSLTSASSEMIYSNEVADDNNRGFIQFEDNDSFRIVDTAGGVNQLQLKTNRLFRDVSAWYHIVVAIDTTQSTASDRLKIYINGVQETSFSTETYPDQNDNLKLLEGGQTNKNLIGLNYGGSAYFGGYLAEFVYIDGTQNAVTDFGEFDEDSGIWKPINVSGLTFGNNGFFLEFKDSSALGDDTSGNSNDFTVNNLTSIDQTTDTPTNNFCTMNPLVRYTANPTFTEGNLSFTGGGGADFAGALGTIAMTQGKWFWECKILATLTNTLVGVQQVGLNLNTSEPQNITGGTTCFYNNDGGEMKTDGTATTNDYGTFSATDIMGVAINMDDKQISIYKNGAAIVSNFALSASSTEVLPFFAMYSSGAIANFGNPTFTITTGNADANGYGNFEYAVPSGYYALCTENLAEYG
jgi:hypothetical protein